MEEEADACIRRTKSSHTINPEEEADSPTLASVPFTINQEKASGLRQTEPGTSSLDHPKSPSANPSTQKPEILQSPQNPVVSRVGRHVFPSQVKRNPVSNRQRSVSPSPQTDIPDEFKEARSYRRRFSTPQPTRKESEKGVKGKWFGRGSRERKRSVSPSPSRSTPIRDLGTLRVQERSRSTKETAWTKYFDNGARRVNAVETADEHGVDMSKLFLGVKFACGLHSRLYHGKYNNEPVAVKLIMVPDDDVSLAARLEKQFSREVTLLSRLQHPNVIKFVGARKDPPVYCIITEYLPEGSLRTYLLKLENKSLPLQKLVAFALDIARGMEHIHSQRIIHRDLKPENVLIDKGFDLKIADFGIACEEEYCDLLDDDPGTYRWMAPEMIKKKPYGKKADVYSFGLLLCEMVAGATPYEGMNPIQAAFAVVHKNLRPVIPDGCPAAMRALIEQCWSSQPSKRPKFWQIVKVLEQFESSLTSNGILNRMPKQICKDHKKGGRHRRWIQKLGLSHSTSLTMPKPKFA